MSDISEITTGDEFFVDPLEAAASIGQEIITQGQLVAYLCAERSSDIGKRVRRYKIRKLEWKDISGDGYTSCIYRVVLHLADDNDDSTFSFLYKSFSFTRLNNFTKEFIGAAIVDLPPEKRFEVINKCGEIHNSECTFYELFANSNCDVPLVSFPLVKIYNIERISYNIDQIPTGHLLMEDLTETACTKSLAEGLTERQVRQVVDALIGFHAALLCDKNESSAWKHKISNTNIMSISTEESFSSFTKQLEFGFDKSAILLLVKRINKVRTTEFFNHIEDVIFKQLGLPSLICHGDMWSNNLLWKKENGEATHKLAAIIDWQISHLGNIMDDFARLLVTSCDLEVRQNVESWLISYYHQRLSKLVGEQKIKLDFTVAALRRAYDYAVVVQSAFCSLLIEPMHRNFLQKSNDEQVATRQTRRLIDRTVAAIRDAEQFLEVNEPEWLTPYEEIAESN